MKVSVIVPTYNSARFLPKAIDSILNQTFGDYEIIIVDDGSTDNTKVLVEGYLKKFPAKVRYFYQKNAGTSVARNVGIRSARGEFIALLDADDIWFPDMLQCAVDEIVSDDAIGLVHGNQMRISENGSPLTTPQRNTKYLSGYIFEDVFLRRANIFNSAVLFRKICCDQVGLYDEHLSRLGCEDRDLWIRITEKYKVKHVDKAWVYYRIAQNSRNNNWERVMEGRTYVIDKFCPHESRGRKQVMRRLALAKIYKEYGDALLFQRNFSASRNQYVKALKFWPFTIWAGINLCKTFLYNSSRGRCLKV